MAERINVYLPDDLHRAIEAHRDRLNVSRICQEALAREVAWLESLEEPDAPLPRLDEEERAAIATRLRAEKDRRESYWYNLGYRTAFEWARSHADPEALEALAQDAAKDAQPVPGWVEGMKHGARRPAIAARTWGELYQQATESAERSGRAPGLDLRAFNRGVRDGAKAVWDAVRIDVVGEDAPEAPSPPPHPRPGPAGPFDWR